MIGADHISASPVHVGSGTVKCAHGVLPVPAPATALILQGIPIYSAEIKGELLHADGSRLIETFCRQVWTDAFDACRKDGLRCRDKGI